MKFLVLQHVPHEHPGLLALPAAQNGVGLEVIELCKSIRIPSSTDDYKALIIMGGPMSVYDSDSAYPSKRDELRAMSKFLEEKKPVLGICLGSQLLAHALGANIYPNVIDDKRVKEIGYHTIDLTEEGFKNPLFRGFSSPVKVLQWHGDAFELPLNSQLLATSKFCRNQAFACGNAYGTLFHFEFTPEMVQKQIEVDREWIHKDHQVDEEELVREAHKNKALMEEQSRKFFSNFLSIVISSV